MKNTRIKKLFLKSETIARLADSQLNRIHGGVQTGDFECGGGGGSAPCTNGCPSPSLPCTLHDPCYPQTQLCPA